MSCWPTTSRPTSRCFTGTCRRRCRADGSRATRAKAFGDYAGYITQQLSDRVKHFMTINEFACFTDLGYQRGAVRAGAEDCRSKMCARFAITASWRTGWACRPSAPTRRGRYAGGPGGERAGVCAGDRDRGTHSSGATGHAADECAVPDGVDGRQVYRRVSAPDRAERAQGRAGRF